MAGFVAELGEEFKAIFTQVLLICDRQGLIGGVKLLSHASKSKSATRKDFQRQGRKMEQAVAKMLEQHRRRDSGASAGQRSKGDRVHRQEVASISAPPAARRRPANTIQNSR